MPSTELSHGILHYHESGAGVPVVFRSPGWPGWPGAARPTPSPERPA